MGVAAYNRGSAAIRRYHAEKETPHEFGVIEMLNRLPKYPDAGTPFGPVELAFSYRVCWVECPVTGYGFAYANAREAVKRWNITITGWDAIRGVYLAEPEQQD